MSQDIWMVLTGVVIIAIVYVLVRPSSNAGQVLSTVTDALSNMIKTAAGSQPSS